ncbi:MAG: threonine--tRNA ligase [Deltaproteobacteria bacterium]|nr:threonine--tRNA ligase [Deltaproteobacteria bacterium]
MGVEKEVAPDVSCGQALKSVLGEKRFENVLAARSGSNLLDLSSSLPPDSTELTPVEAGSPAGLAILRHSAAHVLAAAVRRLFPGVKISIGPAIENGFYYDFDYARPFTPDDFPAIEAEMSKIAAEDIPFTRRTADRAEVEALFRSQGENYKLELLDSIAEQTLSLYTVGDFTDLCRGPHIPSACALRAFKLLSVAGAYWRGDEKNPMLSRIYGTAFAEEAELKAYLRRQEEARKRDHRKLGKDLELFEFHEDLAPGMVFWQPKGMLMRTILEDFLKRENLKRGYSLVQGPQILRKEAWVKSGHYDNYRENMYFTEIEGDVHAVKPMNCVGHILLYESSLHSYRDLPVRMAEFGVVHRHEKSGVLHGLLRVRQFTQDDAHIFCAPEQLEDEILGVLALVRDLFGLFGFEYTMSVSTRPDRSIGSDEAWKLATDALFQALERAGVPITVNEGDGAFYGPKIDVRLTDSLGRQWQCSTVQCDFNLPERFELVYVGKDGERHRPVMVHRAILGSLERFIGILVEHTAGRFPAWLAPVQAKILNVTEAQETFVLETAASLTKAGLRVEADLRNEKLGYKMRQAQLEKVPYILVAGDKEVEAAGVNVRPGGGDSLGLKTLDEFMAMVAADCEKPFKQGGMNYSFS